MPVAYVNATEAGLCHRDWCLYPGRGYSSPKSRSGIADRFRRWVVGRDRGSAGPGTKRLARSAGPGVVARKLGDMGLYPAHPPAGDQFCMGKNNEVVSQAAG
jgi:hypothetical protein